MLYRCVCTAKNTINLFHRMKIHHKLKYTPYMKVRIKNIAVVAKINQLFNMNSNVYKSEAIAVHST